MQAVTSTARVAYGDNDPVVIRHMEALLAQGNPGVSVVDADVADAGTVLDIAGENPDLSAPVCFIIDWAVRSCRRGLVNLGQFLALATAPGTPKMYCTPWAL